MRVIDFSQHAGQPIDLFNSIGATSVHLGDGQGEAHVYCIFLRPGGEIGRHQAGFGQLFLVIQGLAWAEGEDGRRAHLAAGKGAYFAAGEVHSKGSAEGATVIMVQARELALKATAEAM